MKTLKQFLQWLARLFSLGPNEPSDPLTTLAQKIETRATLETIPLAESQKQILCDISTNAREIRSQAGGKAIILFAGVNSTEKTSAAEVIAGGLKRDLYRVDLNKVVSKYIGETEKNLNRLFDAAESAGSVLFFDEAEALFGKRSEVKDAHDRYANLEISYLLQRLESFNGLVILATNNEEDTPEKFRRRVRFVIDFPRPD